MYFFFRLPERKRYQKERARATSTVLLRYRHAQTGLELATLKQIAPYLRLTISPPDAPTPMPEGCAVECCAVKYCTIQDCASQSYVIQNHVIFPPIYAAWSPGLTVGALSVESVFGVKKGRLFERSEFLPFS